MKRTRARAIAAKQRELRAGIARRTRAPKGDPRRRRPSPDEERRRRRRRWLLLALLLVLLLFTCCGSETPLPEGARGGAPVAVVATPSPSAPEPPPGRIPRRDRPRFRASAPEQLPWLPSFRLQVGARSTRLAECFTGVARPGALKWTAAVEPADGQVSDQTLEPTLSSDGLNGSQRACVLGVLSSPPYDLDAGQSVSTPSRVGMVIEF